MENLKTKFDFDDILIIPNTNTHIYSRYRGIALPNELPLFTAPMDTVVDLSNFEFFLENNINVCLPRTIKYDEYIKYVSIKNISRRFNFLTDDINSYNNNIFISVGFTDLDLYYKNNFKIFHENAHILIDVANGHMQKIIDYCKEIKRLRPDIIIMAGNIANPETYRWYAQNNCVDYIRVGIGNGSGCLTTKQSGVGYPMASLIHEIYNIKQQFIKNNPNIKPPFIVADGGMKNYSDIIKALALGCFLPKSLIYTKRGFKCIEKIRVGDYVYSHNGEFKKVLNTFKYSNNKDIIEINGIYSTNNHCYYVLNKIHLNIVNEKNIHEYAEWIAAENLTSEYLLISKKMNLLYQVRILLQKIYFKVFIKKYLYEKKTTQPINRERKINRIIF